MWAKWFTAVLLRWRWDGVWSAARRPGARCRPGRRARRTAGDHRGGVAGRGRRDRSVQPTAIDGLPRVWWARCPPMWDAPIVGAMAVTSMSWRCLRSRPRAGGWSGWRSAVSRCGPFRRHRLECRSVGRAAPARRQRLDRLRRREHHRRRRPLPRDGAGARAQGPTDGLPLVFFRGGYGRFAPHSMVAVPEPDMIGHLRHADLARIQLERAAAEQGGSGAGSGIGVDLMGPSVGSRHAVALTSTTSGPIADEQPGPGRVGASGSSTRTVVPVPGAVCTQNRPPSASTRSLSPTRPDPPAKVAPPRPSSRTRTRSTSPGRRRRVDLDVDDGGVGVLGHVGQRLGDDVVGGDLDRLGQPPVGPHVELDRDGGAAGQRLERRTQAAFGEDRRVDAAGELAQLVQRARSPRRPGRSSCAASSSASGGTAACAARSCSASETSRCWAPSCRSRSMRRRASSAAATIRAREAVSCAWLSALAMAVATSSVKPASRASVSRRQRLLARGRDDHDAPQPPLDADRHADRRADAPRPGRRRRPAPACRA